MLWQSIKRLAKTTIEWEDDNYMGINTLLGARMDKDVRVSGKLYFTFDPLLAQHVLAPRAWARLNVHVVMKLRSKYAVTLYEILEAYANRENKTCIATIDQVRGWLKVPDDAYQSWRGDNTKVIVTYRSLERNRIYAASIEAGLRSGRSPSIGAGAAPHT